MPDAAGSPSAGGQSPQPGGGTPHIDVERLADLVYRLMLADIRLTQARGGGPR